MQYFAPCSYEFSHRFVTCSLIRSLMRLLSPCVHPSFTFCPTATAAPSSHMHSLMPTAFRPPDKLTQPLSSPRRGDFRRQPMSGPASGCDVESETSVDLAIMVTVEHVVISYQDSRREAITGAGLFPSGRLGSQAPSWFSYGPDITPYLFLRSNIYQRRGGPDNLPTVHSRTRSCWTWPRNAAGPPSSGRESVPCGPHHAAK